MDGKITAESTQQADTYVLDGKTFPNRLAAIKYVKTELNCTLTEALKYVLDLPEIEA